MLMLKRAAFGVTACLLAVPTASADVQLRIQNGRVSLVAKDATPRQILAEWGRVGETKIVNGDRVPGGPLTLELTNVSEQQALEVVLRAISGYMLAPRAIPAANLSQFDRIIVMPTSVAPQVSQPSQVFQQQQLQQQLPPPIGDDEDDRRAGPGPAVPSPRGQMFNPFPQPQVMDPRAAPSATGGPGAVATPGTQRPPIAFPGAAAAPNVPTGPFGSSRPGEIVQPPQPQPGGQPGGQPLPEN